MHFWIDKRSQACGYNGRARVAASLSSGSSFGFNQPRRFRGKSMVTPIHRFPTVECTRPHSYRPTSQQASPNNSHITAAQHSSQSSQLYTHNNNNNNNNQQHHQHHSSPHQSQQASTNTGHHQATSTTTTSSAANYSIHRIYNTQSAVHQSGDDNTTMISAVTTRPQMAIVGSSSYDSQLLPSHLKFGLWASLALATIFIASAKLYFDHQGTELKVLIFCAFTATFFLAACGISLCKRPESSDQINTAHTIQTQTDQVPTMEPQYSQTNYADALAAVQAVQPPPPYHIAILLPENSKEELDESPPPSYDKIMI